MYIFLVILSDFTEAKLLAEETLIEEKNREISIMNDTLNAY